MRRCRRGDVIVSYQGNQIRSAAELNKATARTPPGTEVALGLLRGGSRTTVKLTVVDQLALLGEKQTARPGMPFLEFASRPFLTAWQR